MVMVRGVLVLLLACIALCNGGNSLHFVYRENGNDGPSDIVNYSVTLNGSYASLGDWPHWCLGNLSRCSDGLTLEMWIRFTDVAADVSDVLVFSSGGHTWYSNGVYLLQRYGNEYELGVAYEDQLWRVGFRVRPRIWVNLYVTWDLYTGLTFMVDGARHENPDAESRNYQQLAFDSFMDIVVGLSADGTPLTDESRYEISALTFSNWITTGPSEDVENDIMLVGCGEYTTAESISPVPELTSVKDCRAICSAMTKAVAAIRNKTECTCADISIMDIARTNTSSCNPNTDWNFYSASGLDSKDSDYSLIVTIEKIGDKPYVKPFEAVLIHVATNFVVEVPFTVDFGDGTMMDLDGHTVSYFWLVEGRYQITVSTAIGIASISGSTDFSVENVDEGTAGDFVMLNPYHGQESRMANIDFTNIDYGTAVCGIKYGESNLTDIQLTNLEEYVENSYLTNTYSEIGRYRMHVDCLNSYGTIKNDSYFMSKRLQTTFHYHDKTRGFTTSAAGDSDFFKQATVEHHDSNITSSLRHEDASTFIVDPASFRIYENLLIYTFEGERIDTRIINVQNQIEKPDIFSPVIDGAWNLTTNITVRVPPGNNMFLNVSFSAGEDQTFFIHYLPYQSDIMFEIMFPMLGYYAVQANISNDISFSTADMLVSVEVPLRTISLNISNIVHKKNPTVLLIELNDGMQGPMKVNFEIDQGNGYVDTYFHHSDTYFFGTYRHEYRYPDWGTYDVCVRAFNRISSVIDCTTVQVGEKIKYVDILTPSIGRVKPNETVTTLIRSPKGSDKTFIIDFGDEETFVFTDTYLTETEHFLDTTTTTPGTTTTTVQTTTGHTGSTNTTLVPSNTTSGTGTTGTATVVPTGTTNRDTTPAITVGPTSNASGFTTETKRRRRRREANGTDTVTSEVIPLDELGSTTPISLVSLDTNVTTNSTSMSGTLVGNTTDNNETTSVPTTTTTTVTTTTTPIPTTTTMLPSTMEPIPDDASNPYTTALSFARRRRDGNIVVTHRYQAVGTYTIKVQVANHFNWAQDELCPPVMVVKEKKNDSCQPPELTINSKLLSSKRNALQYFRSEQINLTASIAMTGCGGAVPTLSWRTEQLVVENGKTIRRPHRDDGICVLATTEKIFKYPRSTLPFGRYAVTLVVSPAGHPLKVSTHEFYMDVKPSPPHAVIQGDEHLWFLFYGTTMIKFQKSIDPDFDTHDGIQYDLVCMAESEVQAAKIDTYENIIKSSTLVTQGITHKYSSKNPVRLYEHTPCFDPAAVGNLTKDIRFPKGQFYVPSEYFVSDVNSFAMFLYVTKNNLTTMAYRTFEIRMSNETDLLAQLDDLLASKDTTGVMRAVTALSASLVTTSANSSEEEEFEAKEKMTELKAKLIGALDSVSEGVADIDQAGGMIGLVDDLTKDSSSVSDSARVGATSAIKNSAEVTEGFADEPMDTLTGVGGKVVSGVSNVLPKEDDMAKKLAEHEKALQQAEKDTKAAIGPTDEELENPEDGADITLEEGEDQLTELTEEEMASNAPLPYNKLLKKCDLLHSGPLDKLYKYLFFYESIFRQILKNKSEEIMISADILKLPRNDIYCYIGILEEPGDVEWYYNRFFDEEKRRRDLIKKNADRDVSKSFLGAIDSVSSVLLNKTEANQTVELSATGLKVSMKKASANATDGEGESMGDGGAGIKMPAGVMSASGNDSEVGQTLIINDNNPFTYANENDTTSVGTGVVTFKLSTPGTKDEVPVSNTTEPIEINLAANPENVQEPMSNTLILKNGNTQSSMNYHSINVTKNDTTLHLIVRPQFSDSTDLFDVLIQYEEYPNMTHHLEMTTLPLPEDAFSQNLTWEQQEVLRHTFFPSADITRLAGIYKVGVKLRSGNVDLTQEETMFNYTWQMFMGGCRFWNHENETWDSDGCIVGNLTTYNATQCLCTHLTSFGGEMVVPPNTIDFNNVWAKFKNLNENAAVFSTIVSLLGVYVIGLIWARHMDKKDLVKWGATPLEDNLPTDNYHYQLSVYTGLKKNAETKSNISIIMSGEITDTGVRRLFDGKRKTHGKGSIMNYILSVEDKLGPLSFCRIWHDNSGESKYRSWYLDQIEVSDLQTGERSFFLCNRWLACEEDDGMVDRILPVASIEDLVAFKQLFSSSVRKKLANDHLWLSVFSRPTRSSFTRVQRISCCMSLLFLTMITNAMWFKSDGEADKNKQVVAMSIGPFSFTLSQIFISLASTIIVFPPSFLLITLFRRTKQKKNSVMQVNQRQPKRGKWKNLGITSRSNMWGEQPKESKFKKFKESIQELVKGNNKSKYGAEDEEEFERPAPTIAGDPNSKKNAQKKKKKPYMFPYWCNYIAWILCFFSIITPAFFTILYSMEWGKTKANEWLTTFVLSFFQSVIVVQPIKVLCLVAFIACVLKKPDLDEEGDCTNELNEAIATHDAQTAAKGSDALDEIAKRRRQASEALEPPDTEALEESRKARIKEMKMEAILKEIFIYFFFVLILFFLSYQQRDLRSFFYTENIKSLFLGKFEKISTVLDYWKWLEGVFLPTLYAAKFHNGTELVKWWDKRCLTDFQSRRMGIARMRQFRVKEDSCNIQTVMRPAINHCRNDYNWYDDDTTAYLPYWKETSKENRTILDKRRDDPFVYQNSYRLKNTPYMATLQTYKGGGYVVNFERSYRRTKRNLTRLREEDWLDLRTRAVFLEFTVYNPNSNLFASAIMVSEFPASGAAIHRTEFKIFRLQSYVGGFAIVVIFFEVIYCFFTIFFFVRCVKKVKKEKCKYFRTFWDILEFVMLCFGVACIAMYIFKHMLTEVAFHYLKKQSQPEFINFQSLAMYDELYGWMTAIVVFLASIQFLKLLQFNKKMNMLGETVKLATKDLKVFSVAFMLYFAAFAFTAYLLFGKHLAGYSGLLQSTESIFAFTLGAFDFDAMSGAHKFLGPMFFFAFIMVIYVGLMSIFLTIIADAFTTVKEQTANKENEYEMVDFIWRKFKGIIGVK